MDAASISVSISAFSKEFDEQYTAEQLSPLDVSLSEHFSEVKLIVQGQLNDVLLLDGLYDLITEKWPMVGARLVHEKQGGLSNFALQTPNVFGYEHPPVLFDVFKADADVALDTCFKRLPETMATSSTKYDDAEDGHQPTVILGYMEDKLQNIDATRIKRQLPINQRQLQCSISRFCRDGMPPKTRKELIDQRAPLLNVALYLFPHSNESVLRICFPRAVFDAWNITMLLQAWSQSVAGQLDDVPDIKPAHHALEKLKSDKVNNKSIHPASGQYIYTIWHQMLFCIMLVWRNVLCSLLLRWRLPKPARRACIFMPYKKLQMLRKELEPAPMAFTAKVSDEDLCFAWLISRYAQERKSILNGLAYIALHVNVRNHFPGISTLPYRMRKASTVSTRSAAEADGKGAFAGIHSFLLHTVSLPLPVCTMSWRALGRMKALEIARVIRQPLLKLQQDSPKETLATFVRTCAAAGMAHARRRTSATSPWHAECIMATTWKYADVLEFVDFSTAVLSHQRQRSKEQKDDYEKHTQSQASSNEMKAGMVTEFDVRILAPTTRLSRSLDVVVLGGKPGQGLLMCCDLDERSIIRGMYGTLCDGACVDPESGLITVSCLDKDKGQVEDE